MSRFAAALLLIALSVPGCSLLPMFVADVDPLCQDRPDAIECHAALQAVQATHGFAFELERHAVRVEPVVCDAEGCSTAVFVSPPADECLPAWTFIASRPLIGAWEAGASLHGDPDCGFAD